MLILGTIALLKSDKVECSRILEILVHRYDYSMLKCKVEFPS